MSILSIYYVNINDVLTYDNAPYVVFCRFCLEENIWGGGISNTHGRGMYYGETCFFYYSDSNLANSRYVSDVRRLFQVAKCK